MRVLLTHGDADGVCAGAIVSARYPDCVVELSRPSSIASQLREFSQAEHIIVTDIAVDPKRVDEISGLVKELGDRIVYIDHHPNRIEGQINEQGKSASEIAWEVFGEDLNPELKWLGVIGGLADQMLTSFV